MRPSDVIKQLAELRESWRKQSFSYTPEQQKQYDTLTQLRRERVKYFYKEGLVSKGGKKEKEVDKAVQP